MKSSFRFGSLASAILSLGCCIGAAAQSAPPVPSPSATTQTGTALPSPAAAAPAPSPTPFKLITLSGFGDAGFTAVGLTDKVRFTTGLPSRIFDSATGPFFDANGGRELSSPSDFNRTPNREPSTAAERQRRQREVRGQLRSDADVIASNGQSRSGSNLTQGYVQVVQGPITLVAGKFSSLAGAEVIESPNDTNFSRSYLFGDAVPFTHTGVRLTYAATAKLSLIAGANNGWDDWKFAGKKKTLEGAVVLNPSPGYSLTLDTYNGSDFAASGSSSVGALPLLSN